MSLTEIVETLARGIPATLLITVASFAIGLVAGAAVVAARLSRHALVRRLATGYIEIVRGIPPIVWLFVIFFGLGQGALEMSAMVAGIVGLGLISSAYVAEMYRAGILSVARGQWDAARMIGLSPTRAFLAVIAPQAAPVVVPPAATYAIGLLKDSALVSVLGAQEVTFRAYQAAQNHLQGLEIFLVAAGVYIVLSVPVAVASRQLNARLSVHLVRP